MARPKSDDPWSFDETEILGGKMRRFEVPQYTQIGNAVPPLLGFALGKVCARILNDAQ